MHTVRAAEERNVPVLAVPGPIKSRASAGTNQLLSQGCHPVCDGDDVLAALSLRRAGPQPRPGGLRLLDSRTPPPDDHVDVLHAIDWSPTSLEVVLARCAAPPAKASASLAWLEREGWVRGEAGWWERC